MRVVLAAVSMMNSIEDSFLLAGFLGSRNRISTVKYRLCPVKIPEPSNWGNLLDFILTLWIGIPAFCLDSAGGFPGRSLNASRRDSRSIIPEVETPLDSRICFSSRNGSFISRSCSSDKRLLNSQASKMSEVSTPIAPSSLFTSLTESLVDVFNLEEGEEDEGADEDEEEARTCRLGRSADSLGCRSSRCGSCGRWRKRCDLCDVSTAQRKTISATAAAIPSGLRKVRATESMRACTLRH
mmetsp:Transcript_15748/g.38840  ORF Transcript_15748/g.38840 Transcript_15748/m.38840 type:complete len:240 (+) Transcript_15748:901-1620(+)